MMNRRRRTFCCSTLLFCLWILHTCCTIEAFVSSRQRRTSPSRLLLAAHRRHKYLATCLPGLSSVVEEELQQIQDVQNVQRSGSAAVMFEGDSAQVGLEALLWTRATHRIMEFLCEATNVETRDDIYDFIQNSVDVKELLGDGRGGLLTLSVRVVLSNARDVPADINHSHYTALTIKNALVDAVRDLRGDRPDVDIDHAQVPLIATIRGAGPNTSLSLYKCLHNGSLHRRGYRSGGAIHKAAMKESMAAGLLLATGHDFLHSSTILVDPMAGSGSLVLEGAMMMCDLAPGLMRIKCGMTEFNMPPVVRWKTDEDVAAMWKDLLLTATQRAKAGLKRMRSSGTRRLIANDVHPCALDLLEESLHQAGLQDLVDVRQGDCQDLIPPRKCLVVTNPPWGVRLTEDMHESWESLRVFLRENCSPGTEAWVLSGNKEATKHLGLRRSQSVVLQTGQQDLRWIQYMIIDKTQVQTRQQQERQHPKPERSRTGKPDRRRYQENSYRGYERRNKVATANKEDKSVTKPQSQAEREERKNSWYI